MSLEQLIAILRARWLVALIAFTLVATGVTVYTLLLPKSYTASGSVLVDIRSPDPIAGSVLAGVTQPQLPDDADRHPHQHPCGPTCGEQPQAGRLP